MARRLFFVDEVVRGRAEIRGEHAYHLTRVLRVEPGQRYEISDNSDVYFAEVDAARKDLVSFRVIEAVTRPAPPLHLTVFASIIKFDHFEWLLEKVTEAGASAIVPVESERSERGLEKAAGKRLDRWRRILLESSQQSRRSRMPDLGEPIPFSKAVRETQDGFRYLLDEESSAPPMLDVIPKQRTSQDRVSFLVGPEGGWAAHEQQAARAAGWAPVSLGPNILRSETAALAAAAILMVAWAQKPGATA